MTWHNFRAHCLLIAEFNHESAAMHKICAFSRDFYTLNGVAMVISDTRPQKSVLNHFSSFDAKMSAGFCLFG